MNSLGTARGELLFNANHSELVPPGPQEQQQQQQAAAAAAAGGARLAAHGGAGARNGARDTPQLPPTLPYRPQPQLLPPQQHLQQQQQQGTPPARVFYKARTVQEASKFSIQIPPEAPAGTVRIASHLGQHPYKMMVTSTQDRYRSTQGGRMFMPAGTQPSQNQNQGAFPKTLTDFIKSKSSFVTARRRCVASCPTSCRGRRCAK
nr:uncharacterized protein LOC116650255 [Drosophila virilis]